MASATTEKDNRRMITFREDCKYALLGPTSMGVRLTPFAGQGVHCSTTFTMQVTSAESNVASVSSNLGLPVKVLTAFVKGSPISRMIRDDLAGRHMDFEGPEVEQGGPWGYRHQINMADSGHGSRGLITAPLSGELIAAWLEDEPLPVPREVAEASHPNRFMLRRLIRGS